MFERKVRIGIIGTGKVASLHEAGYAEIDDLCELVAFCDTDEVAARSHAKPYQAKIYTAYQDLLANAEIDIIDISLPYPQHYPIALAALEAGKHVLVEKPMALTAAQALELIETARRMNVRFTVAENTHFIAAYQEARRILQAGTLGEVRLVRMYSAGNETGECENQESGLMLSSPLFYLLQWLLGGITDMQAISYKLLPESPVEDHILVIGHLANGAVFTGMQSCTSDAAWNERLEIHGSLGSLVSNQLANPPVLYIHGSEEVADPLLDATPFEPLAWKYLSIVAEVQDFVQAVIDEHTPGINPLDSYHAMQTVEAIYRSLAEEKSASSEPINDIQARQETATNEPDADSESEHALSKD